MYEDQTPSVINDRLLTFIEANYPSLDTREGSIAQVAVAPAALECSEIYSFLDAILMEGYGDTASRTFLIKRAAERGLIPDPATKAIIQGSFTPSALQIAIGERFRTNGLNYAITEKITDGAYKLECETAGAAGNQIVGDLIPVGTVPGLKTCELTAVLIPGEDEEETEVFRARYYASFQSQAFGGNFDDYREKVNKLQGVGGVKVYPVWNGGGTVKCVIINSDYATPAAELIAAVQLAVDPVPLAGKGAGAAPIDHVVTITGVSDIAVNITATITYESGWTFEAVKPYIESAIDAYLLELRKSWESTQSVEANTGLIVRVSQIETRLLDLTGILDIANTVINGVSGNLTLAVDQIPVRGLISGS